MSDKLEIRDLRTGQKHTISVHEGGYVNASDLSKIGQRYDSATRLPTGGLRIFDKGFQHTACMQSDITLVDGHQGCMTFRGRSIQDLFYGHDFEQVMHLLIWGEIPGQDRLLEVRRAIAEAMQPPKLVLDVIRSFPRDAPVYSMKLAGLTAFTASSTTVRDNQCSIQPMFHGNMAQTDRAIIQTLGYYAATIALIHCHRQSKEFQSPDSELTMAQNILRMMGEDTESAVGLLDKLWILYADHELTASTAAVLHTGATLADPLSSIIAGVTAAYGPLHVGAINLVYEQLKDIGSVDQIPEILDQVRAKKMRLFGFGHRTFKTRDPRLALIEELTSKYAAVVEDDTLFSITRELEIATQKDEYFIKRNLKANVDLKGYFLCTAFGFDVEMSTALISVARAAGGLAHWRETQTQPIKLWRPQQIYIGPRPEAGSAVESEAVYTIPATKALTNKLGGFWNYALATTLQSILAFLLPKGYTTLLHRLSLRWGYAKRY